MHVGELQITLFKVKSQLNYFQFYSYPISGRLN